MNRFSKRNECVSSHSLPEKVTFGRRLRGLWQNLQDNSHWKYEQLSPVQLLEQSKLHRNSTDIDELARADWFWSRRPRLLPAASWIEVKAGDHVHVPGNGRHAWRNTTSAPFVTYVIITPKLGKFFQEVGRPIGSTEQPVTAEDIADFLVRYASVAKKYDCWNATPEENAAVAIYL